MFFDLVFTAIFSETLAVINHYLKVKIRVGAPRITQYINHYMRHYFSCKSHQGERDRPNRKALEFDQEPKLPFRSLSLWGFLPFDLSPKRKDASRNPRRSTYKCQGSKKHRVLW